MEKVYKDVIPNKNMFVEKKIIGGRVYYYLKHSFRHGKKIKTKTLAYIGNKKDEKKIKKLKQKFNKQELDKIKKELFDEKDWNKIFLSASEREKIEKIQKDFSLKIKKLDEKTKREMFDDFLTYFIYNTNAIEGNTLTLKETDLLLNKGITPQGRSLREVNDHLNARDIFYHLEKSRPALNEETIIDIHDSLMKKIDERRGYRKHNVRVIGAGFKTTPFKYIKSDMTLLMKWYHRNKKKLHPVVLASLFHHKFEKIHPFYDGNGRTGRVILNIMLLEKNVPPIILSNKQRKTYYNALSKADQINLTEIDENFEILVKFISTQVMKTHNTIFSRWG